MPCRPAPRETSKHARQVVREGDAIQRQSTRSVDGCKAAGCNGLASVSTNRAGRKADSKPHHGLADGSGEAGGESAGVDWVVLHAHSLAILHTTHVKGEATACQLLAYRLHPAGRGLACAAQPAAQPAAKRTAQRSVTAAWARACLVKYTHGLGLGAVHKSAGVDWLGLHTHGVAALQATAIGNARRSDGLSVG